jgi:hypothetical protein
VEAAGIEPGQPDDPGAVSPQHLAQVLDPPRQMVWPACAISRGEPPSASSVDQRDHGGPAQEELAALYGTDLVFVLGADGCSCCGRAQRATAVVRERRALRGDPVGEMGEHSIVGRRLAPQRKRRIKVLGEVPLLISAIDQRRSGSRALVVQIPSNASRQLPRLPLFQAFP